MTYLVLATVNEPSTDQPPLPTLCGVYTERQGAEGYAAWENARDDYNAYYVMDAAELAV